MSSQRNHLPHRKLKHRVLLILTTAIASGISVPTIAQGAPPSRPVLDSNGVDIATGKVVGASKDVKLDSFEFSDIWNGPVNENTFSNYVYSLNMLQAVVFVEGRSIKFMYDSGNAKWEPELNNGAVLAEPTEGQFIYTAPSGAKYEFSPNAAGEVRALHNSMATLGTYSWLNKVTHPNGETLTWHYRTQQVEENCRSGGRFGPICDTITYQRPQSVTSNTGKMLKATYATNTGTPAFNNLTAVTAINRRVDYCDPMADSCNNLSRAWPTMTITTVTNNGNLVDKTFATLTSEFRVRLGDNGVTQVNSDNSGTADRWITYYPDGKVYQFSRNGIVSTYNYAIQGAQTVVTVTDTTNATITFVMPDGKSRLDSKTDELGHTTSFEYDAEDRLYKMVNPEGDQTILTYDPIGRVTETRRKAKPGSGLADIVATAGFVPNCTVDALKYCMKPLWTVDARGNRTDFTYSADSGELIRVQLPAASGGAARGEMNYGYTALYAKEKDAAGNLVDAPSPVWKLTTASQCATTSTCAGSVGERKMTISYALSGGGLNLNPTQVTIAAGNGASASSSSYVYDENDNVVAVDGPLPGPDDTTYYFWNADKKLIGIIGPDPDGGGALPRQAARNTYVSGRLTQTESGTATGTDQAALNVMSVAAAKTIAYDNNDNVSTEMVVAGGTTHSATQYSYNQDGLLECTAIRMNPGAFGALPASACSLGPAGSAGADRITRFEYDAAGQQTKSTSAYGTADQADDATVAYTNNGQQASVTDANGNVTSYAYDGFDRLNATTFSGGSYEQLGYDTNGNVTSRRMRDGQVIGYGYDALNRLVTKDSPNVAYWETDQSYAYDLLGNLTSASDSNGRVLGFGYNALGQRTSQSDNWYGHGNASFQYDAAGNRTRLTWGDGQYVSYDYLTTGAMKTIRDGAGNALITFDYDGLGRRSSLTRANGTVTQYGFDPTSQLNALTLAGGNQPNSISMSHNPAGQIASRTASNDVYAWTGHVSVDRAYGVNGLNQLTSAGSTPLGYDGRGNLTSSGSDSYSYTANNQMAAMTGVTGLAYDPLGRLFNGVIDSGVNTTLTYDGGDVLAETDQNTGSLLRRYVYGPGTDEPLIWYEGPGFGDRRFLHADERGSIIAVTNDAGSAIAVNRYDEFGIPQPGNLGRFQYTGQKWLPNLGLYDYKARIYSSTLGRFMQTDPIHYADGINWYNYVGGDPVNKIDPTGMYEDGEEVVVTGKRIRAAGITGNLAALLLGGAGGGGYNLARGDGVGGGGLGAQNNTKACQALSDNTNESKGALPPYITNNKNWNNISTLQGYMNLYQSSYNEYSAFSGGGAALVLGGLSIACTFYAPCSAARVSVPLSVGMGVGAYSTSALKDSTAAAVAALKARIQQLKSGC